MFRMFGRFLTALICLAAGAVTFGATSGALAQACESMSGSARTDCFIGRARISGQKSEIAGSAARVRNSQERLRAVTGGVYAPNPRKTKSPHKTGTE